MTAPSCEPRIVATPDCCSGEPRIEGHRIRVMDVAVWHDDGGMSAGEIARTYDLEIEDVEAALAYLADHRAEIENSIARDVELFERRRHEEPGPLQRKLEQLGRSASPDAAE